MATLTPEVELLATDWFRRVRESAAGHYEAGTYFSRLNLLLGLPTIALSTVVGTAVFATLQKESSNEVRLALGLLSILAAILASLHTFLGFAQRAEKHRLTGSGYGAIRRTLELLKTMPPADEAAIKQAVESIKASMDNLAASAPELPTRLKHRIDKRLKSKEHRRIFHLQGRGVADPAPTAD